MLILISINFIISGYSIGFDAHGIFALSDGNGFGKNVIIFGADMHLLVILIVRNMSLFLVKVQ